MGDKINDSQSFEREDSFKETYMQSGSETALHSRASVQTPIVPKVTVPYGEDEGGRLSDFFGGIKDKVSGRKKNAQTEPQEIEMDVLDEHGKKVDTEEDDDQFDSAIIEDVVPDPDHEADLSSVEIPAMVREIDSKKGKATESQPEQEEMSMFAFVRSNNDYAAMHLAFMNYSQEVIHKKREALIGHHSNDNDFKRVIEAIQMLHTYLGSPVMSSDEETYKNGVKSVMVAYDSTYTVIKEYLDKKENAKTPSGKKRWAYVSTFSRLLEVDKNNLDNVAKKLSLDDAKKMSNYNDLIFSGSQIIVKAEQESSAKTSTKDTADESKKEEYAVLPSESSIKTAKDLYGKFKDKSDKEEDLLTILISAFRSNPVLKGKNQTLDPEEAAYAFMAAYIENNPYNPGIEKELKQESLDGELMCKTVSSSDAARKFSFLESVVEIVSSNTSVSTLLMYFMQYASNDSKKDIDTDGPPDDEK